MLKVGSKISILAFLRRTRKNRSLLDGGGIQLVDIQVVKVKRMVFWLILRWVLLCSYYIQVSKRTIKLYRK